MVSPKIEAISSTLSDLAEPGISSKEFFELARSRHPRASRKEIMRAAFYALIRNADGDKDKSRAVAAVRLQSAYYLGRLKYARAPEPRGRRIAQEYRIVNIEETGAVMRVIDVS